jgi:hypothetical protein
MGRNEKSQPLIMQFSIGRRGDDIAVSTTIV